MASVLLICKNVIVMRLLECAVEKNKFIIKDDLSHKKN